MRDKLVVTGVLVIMLVAMGLIYNSLIKPSQMPKEPRPTPTRPAPPGKRLVTDPPQVVKEYYGRYIDCIKNPPPEAVGAVSVYCQSNNTYASPDLANNIATQGARAIGFDPILCAQNIPSDLTVTDTQISNTRGTISVSEQFETTTVQTQVTLAGDGEIWKVANVTCPTP